ncbi:putative hydrolase of the HAD superfamily [Noviherbaspirillum humi]|uniref:Putative hydrolase of the HAD superfamily n=1 Tax=Noviherbaspirillum humi TaxID=1688639 RepID=A0A239E4A2_9BURK|nr:HAD family hydrolase [Noviherbaspirillum humi]SNS39565.1 putative hydrolase of the HAD superfamily [Noviherbaspirillum humi]
MPANNPAVIKAVLFDLDDTLWPIVPVIRRAEDEMFAWLERHAPAVTREFTIDSLRARRMALMKTDPVYQLDLKALRHAGLTEAFRHVGEDLAKVDAALEVFSTARNRVEPFADVLPVLASLRRRVLVGSVSNGVADLGAIGLAHFFSTSIAACHFGSAKPDPAIFHAACESLGVLPSEAVYVGDDPLLDVKGAKQAGLHALWLNRPELGPARELPPEVQPDAICTTLFDLENWLSGRMIVLPPQPAGR